MVSRVMKINLKYVVFFFLPFFLLSCSTTAMTSSETLFFSTDNDGEARPFTERQNDVAKVDAAIIKAGELNQKALIVMGANWCHDSRALATHFHKPKFKKLIQSYYVLEYVDVGQKNKNQDIARRFGLDGTPGTPTVLIIDGTGTLLNPEEAPTWRNAASRSENEIYSYFENYAIAEPRL